MLPIVIREILRMFVNTLTPGDKYPIEACEILSLPIQTQLS